jgi:hypothetical protein
VTAEIVVGLRCYRLGTTKARTVPGSGLFPAELVNYRGFLPLGVMLILVLVRKSPHDVEKQPARPTPVGRVFAGLQGGRASTATRDPSAAFWWMGMSRTRTFLARKGELARLPACRFT